MPYTPTNAVYRLNSYVFKVLEANLGWDKADYDGATPIIPSAQQPEFLALGKPFIVYSSATDPVGHLYALKSESVAYTIYGQFPDDVDKIANLLGKAFEGQDDSAYHINQHLDDEGANKGVSFASAVATMVEKADSADEEGGLVAATVMLKIMYVEHNDDVQLSGFTYP